MHNAQGDRFTRVTYRENPGFFQRVKQSLFGIIVGLVLIIVSSVLLFWNEVIIIINNFSCYFFLPGAHIVICMNFFVLVFFLLNKFLLNAV